jgi:hypothetical protein
LKVAKETFESKKRETKKSKVLIKNTILTLLIIYKLALKRFENIGIKLKIKFITLNIVLKNAK